jgi:pyruvate dehydrogenase E2 component (dihydrolipoamide acetyltransferase)
VSEPYTIKPLSPMRQVIATRMTQAVRDIPHFRLTCEINFDPLIALRRELNAERADADVSLNDLLIKACADTLMEQPDVNVQWADNELHQYATADISVITSVEYGLAMPIVRRAETKTVQEISTEVRQLVDQAKQRKLKASQMSGGSFAISNLGMYGIDEFDAIINPPQCAILAVAAAKLRVMVSANKEVLTAAIARCTLSCDHRAIDGALGAKFLSALRRRLENPDQVLAGPRYV